MILNYLKLAWRSLKKNKFFTFISLFGISFTLAVLMLLSSYFQTEFSYAAPMTNKDELIYLRQLVMQTPNYDTITIIDTVSVGTEFRYDSIQEIKKNGYRNMSNSQFSKKLLLNYFSKIPTASDISVFHNLTFDVFVNNSKLVIDVQFTDDSFWSIFNFKFIEGRPYDSLEVESNNPIIIITEELANSYFGQRKNVIGKEVVIAKKAFKVIGVVQTPMISRIGIGESVSNDAFMPYSLTPDTYTESYYFGRFKAVIRKNKDSTLDQLKKDIYFASQQIPLDHPDNDVEYKEIDLRQSTFSESFAQYIIWHEKPKESLKILLRIIIGLISLFILLPMLNLFNINISRIMDRASEIGVRKAFGASKTNILYQFVFENIVLTLIGGIIALAMTSISIYLLNDSKILGSTVLHINIKFFISGLIISIIFGIISGLLPAYKMSKLHIVDALKKLKS